MKALSSKLFCTVAIDSVMNYKDYYIRMKVKAMAHLDLHQVHAN